MAESFDAIDLCTMYLTRNAGVDNYKLSLNKLYSHSPCFTLDECSLCRLISCRLR